MSQEEFDDYFLGLDLMGETPESTLVFVRWDSDGELGSEFLRKSFPQTYGSLIIDSIIVMRETECLAQLFVGRLVHPNEQAAAVSFTTRPSFNE